MGETDSSKHPPRASKRARAAFNWPPTDQDLAELGILFPEREAAPAGETANKNASGAALSNGTEPTEGEAIAAETAATPEAATGESTRANSQPAGTSRKRRKKKTTESLASPFDVNVDDVEQEAPRRARGNSKSRLKPVPPGTGGPFNWPPTDEELAEFTKPFEPLTPEIIAARQRAEAHRGPRDIWSDENDDAEDASETEVPDAQSGPVRPWQRRQGSRSALTLGRLLAAAVIAYALVAAWWRWGLAPQVPSSSTNRPVASTPARAPQPQSTDARNAAPTPPSESAAAPAPRQADVPSSVTTAPVEVPRSTPAVAANRPAEPSAPVAKPSDVKTRAATQPTPTTARARTPSTARGPEPATPLSATPPPAAISEAPAAVEPAPLEVARRVEPPAPAEPVAIAREPETRAPPAPATPAPATAATPVPASPVPAPAVALGDDRSAIQRVLVRYESAYDQLDAGAAVAVWPSVDARALERAFARLQNQDLEFHQCDVDVQSNGAMAQCSGELRYVRRVGSVAPRAEPHTWTIQLERFGEDWRIARVTGR